MKITHPEMMDQIGVIEPLSKTGARCSAHAKEIIGREPDRETTAIVAWAAIQWFRAGKPIFRLEAELLQALMNTRLPEGEIEIPEIPFEGFFIDLDGEWVLEDKETGEHKIDGIYVCRDLVNGRPEIVQGILVVAMGEDKNKSLMDRNDTVQYFATKQMQDLSKYDCSQRGFREVVAVSMNLLMLMASAKESVEAEEVTPTRPKSPKKIKRAKRKGLSFSKYTVLRLSEKAKSSIQSSTDKSKTEWDGPTHTVIVRGHWHKYWVLDPGNRQVFNQSTRGEKEIYLIRKWIHPYPAIRRGPDPKRNVYKVVK